MSDPHPISQATAELSAGQMRERLESDDTTSVDIIDVLISRIESCDTPESATQLRAFAALNGGVRDDARERDLERQRGSTKSVLHGIPVVIKDNIEALGLPGMAGSTALAGRGAVDAPLVTRLREAGMLIIGSTNLSEWANIRSPRSTSGWSATGGLVGNPWALDRSAGGSSSGSGAAVAAGLSPLGIGTETDGSIVCPASLQGLFGIKPTVGKVPTAHVVPISASQDSPGPMGRHLEDVVALYEILANEVLPLRDPKTVRFAIAKNWRTGHPATDARFDDVVEELRRSGFSLVEREVAEPTEEVGGDELTVLLSELRDDLGDYLSTRPGAGPRSLEEVVAHERAHADVELAYFGHENFELAVQTGGRSGEAYEAARQRNLQWAIRDCLEPALEAADVLLSPSYGPAWKSDLIVGGHAGVAASCATTPPAIAGWPIANVPMGLVENLPVGLAVIARANDEASLVAAARICADLDLWQPQLPTWSKAQRG